MLTGGKKRKTGLARLIEISGTKKWWLIGSMLLSVGFSIALFIPYVAAYQILTELAAQAQTPQLVDRELIRYWGVVSLGAIFISGILQYISSMFSHVAAFNILYELRIALARKLARLPMGYFSRNTTGRIKKVMSEDVERIEMFVAHHVPDIAAAVVFPLLIVSYLFVVDRYLALVVCGVFIAAVVLQGLMVLTPRMRSRYEEYHRALGRMNSSIIEYVRGIQVVKVFGRSLQGFERLQGHILEYRDCSIGVTRSFAPVYTGYLVLLSSLFLFLIPAALLLLLRAPSYPTYIPTVFLFFMVGGGTFFPLQKLLYMGSLYKQNSLGVALIDEILDTTEISAPECPQVPVDNGIVFDNVSFAYAQEEVLKNASFTAAPGTITALVGPSGAGKSTIGMLAARFWDVTAGEIRIGGVPIKEIKMPELMRHIAFVFQDNPLFFDTIEENIRMGNRCASFAAVMAAAKAAHCHEFIGKLDRGYQTLVGEGGIYLSGGEQQRIALARAILKDAPLVILDEATAFADPENESKILASFARLVQGKTVLVIAHRLSTIVNADQILVVDKGVIVERGRHADLLAHDGLYQRLWQTYQRARDWQLRSTQGREGAER